MNRKSLKLETAKPPRTVQELTPWLNDQFGLVRDLVHQVVDAAQAVTPSAAPSPSVALSDPVAALLASLREALVHCEAVVAAGGARAAEPNAAPELARALLLAGNGERFEPSIQAAIREYCEVRQEILRCARQTRIPDEVREDVLAGWNRFLANRKQDLRLLSVTIEEVAEGSPLDLSRHLVVQNLTAERSDCLNTVRLCITPVMTWKNAYGMERLEPGRVEAYTLWKEPERAERTRGSKTGNSSAASLFSPSKAYSPFDHP